MTKRRSQWKLIEDYPIKEYRCGARAGERVRLLRDFVVRRANGQPTGDVHRAGEVWTVINGAAEPPLDVWLRRPDGQPHTWNDGEEFWAWFERVTV